MTACTPEKENNYLLCIIHIIKNDSFIYKSQEHTNVQIKVNFFISWRLIVDVGVLVVFYIKSPTTQCLIILGHFAMSTPTFFKFHRHFLYFTNVGPVGFLAKTRCAYCTCNKLVIRTNILFQCFPLNYQIYCLGHCYSPCTWTNN